MMTACELKSSGRGFTTWTIQFPHAVCLTSEQRGGGPLVDAPDAALPPERARHVRRPRVLGRPRRGLLHLKGERGGKLVVEANALFALKK